MFMIIFTLFFALGVWLLQHQTTLPNLAGAWLLLSWPLALLIPAKPLLLHITRTMLIASLACGLGFLYAAWQADQRLAVTLPDAWQGRNIEIIGVVAELPRNHPQGQRFVFDVEQVITPGVQVPARIYLSTYSNPKSSAPLMHAAERWQITVRLKQPHGSSNPHGYDFEAWALENNLRALGYVHNKIEPVRLDRRATGLAYRIQTWRAAVRDHFNTTLAAAPYAGVLSALAIGDQSSIPAAQWQVYTRTGVNHLMSISGLHITMLSSLAFALGYWLWRRSVRLVLFLPARKAAALIALLVALSYALLSGFAVPAQRTVYMVAAVAAALWLNRNFSLTQILCIALLGVLIPDPWAVISPGFWLSFGAVALILYVTAHRIATQSILQIGIGTAVATPTSHSWQVLGDYAKVQWAMMIGLTPILLGLFQQVSLVSPLANAFAIPLVSLIVVPLTLLGALVPLDVILWLAHSVMSGIITLLEWLSALPQAVWTQHAQPPWSVVAGILGALWILAPSGFPARWLGIFMLLPMFLNTPEPPAQDSVRVIIFDVGQGLSVAVQTRHHALLYDAGPDFSADADSGNRILIPALRGLGISKLDGLILSHDDSDHTGGATSLLHAMPLDWLMSTLRDGHPLLQNVADQRRCIAGTTWLWDGVQFEILHPVAASYASTKIKDNNRSCVLRISVGEQHVLLTGDIEKISEQQLLEQYKGKLAATLLLVPHHGSKTSSSSEFIAAVHPVYAVFTTGYRNRYGHPKPEVVQRYADINAQLMRSDADGAILVELNAQGLQLERHRKSQRRYWTHRSASGPDSNTQMLGH